MSIKTFSKFSMGLKVIAILGITSMAVLALVPREAGVLLADNNANCTTSTTPTFNPYPVSNNPGNCQDYPFIASKVIHSDGSQTGFSTGSIQAQPGDKVEVQLYIDNGAALGSPALTNIQLTTSAVLSAGSSHSVSASVTASNANNSLSGSLNILTPNSSTLQVDPLTGQWYQQTTSMGNLGNIVNTTTHLPDQAACFPYVRFINMVFDVVGQQVTQSVTLTATPNPVCIGALTTYSITSTVNGPIVWTSTFNGQPTGENNSYPGQNLTPQNGVYVWSAVGDYWGDHFHSGNPLADVGTWTKTATINGVQSNTVTFQVKDCTPPVQKSASITATLGSANKAQCLYNGNVTWQSSGYDAVAVYVQSVGANDYSLVAANLQGSTNIPWFIPGRNYEFTLWTVSVSNGVYTKVSQIADPAIVNVPALDCTVPVTLTCSASPILANINDPVTFGALGGSGPYSWTNGENPATGSGQSFTTSFSSAGNKTVTVHSQDGQIAYCSVTIKQPVQKPATLNCATPTIQANIDDTVTFGANGGTAPYSWSNGGNPSNGSGQNFSTKFSSSGNKTVTVSSSDGQTAYCSVTINPPPVNKSASITATLGSANKAQCLYNGNVTWQSSGYDAVAVYVQSVGANDYSLVAANLQGSTNIPWFIPGRNYEFTLWTVSVSNGVYTKVSQIADPAIVNVPALDCTVPVTLTCSASPNPVDINNPVIFTATGGAAPYNWSNGGYPSTGSGQSFSTTYSTAGTKTATVSSSDGQTANCSVVVKPTVQQNAQLTLTKQVKNLGPSQTTLYDKSVLAEQGDAVRYLITVTNISSVTANNVSVTDTQGSSAGNVTTSGSNGSAVPISGSLQNGLNFGSLAAGSSVYITYTLPVNVNSGSIDNTATVSASNANSASDSAVVTITAIPICQADSNFALNASTPVKNGSSYSVTLTWSSTGNNQIKITQINPGAGYENTIAIGSSSGSQTINGLLPGSTYIFKMYDVSCSQFLTSVQVVTPSNPGQLTCSVQSSTINSGSAANFTAQGGMAPYNWSGDGSPSSGSGSSYNPVYTNTTTSSINHSVSVTSSDGQTANCSVVVNGQQQNNGNINNNCVNNSCNDTTNNTDNSVNNSNNPITTNTDNSINNSYNNTSSINDSYNNYTYNNTVYISSNGNVVPANQFSQLSITKSVRDVYNNYNSYNNYYNGSFSNSVSANNGDTVQFQIVVSNSGSATANNVRVTDILPSGLNLVYGSVTVNGSQASDNNLSNGMYLGSLSSSQSETITFSATVSGYGSSSSIQNTATASSDNAGSVQASAWVFVNGNGNVLGGNVNLTYSKSALNNTKNQDATAVAASREDFITYTLTASNSGNTPATNFIITDDLSQVLPYADMTDFGGGSLNGNVITFPGITVPANGSVTRSFEVRVKYSLSSNLSYVMTNTYGNTVTIRINTPQVLGAFTAPKTGADTNAFVFAGILTSGLAIYKKKNLLMKLIFN